MSAAFRKAIQGTPHEALWLLMMLTGLGPGEVLALAWEHLDLEAGVLRVARTLDTKAGELVEDTKRPSRKRVVPLVSELRGLLRERWLAAGRPPAGLLFADQLGQPLDLHNLRARHFKPALEAAEITRRVRIYDLRHGFATAARGGRRR
jgi:integrase